MEEEKTIHSFEHESIIYDLRVYPDGCAVVASFPEEEDGEEIDKELVLALGLPELNTVIAALTEMRDKILSLPAAQQCSPVLDDGEGDEEEEEEEEEEEGEL